MPLVAHNKLPTFKRLRESGQDVLSLPRARRQDIRALHIGLLNMMPDAALLATEQQFMGRIGSSRHIAQFYVYPFSLPELLRGTSTQTHIQQHYFEFAKLREQGLDALIVTGANVANPALDQEAFWPPLMDVIAWARENVASVLCSCLATHALLQHIHGIRRRPLPQKKWGIYAHRINQPDHPLVAGIDTRFDAPHSRYNEVTTEQLAGAGITVLASSKDADVHLAVSPDRFRIVYFQGHPEYDAVSLLKEYKREVLRYLDGDLAAPPPLPENYFSAAAERIAAGYMASCQQARKTGSSLPLFPEDALAQHVDNTWGDTGRAIIHNWLGLVYQAKYL
jgi:homoserine O-succinyltransferase